MNFARDIEKDWRVVEGRIQERVQQARTAFGLSEKDLILRQHKVSGWRPHTRCLF